MTASRLVAGLAAAVLLGGCGGGQTSSGAEQTLAESAEPSATAASDPAPAPSAAQARTATALTDELTEVDSVTGDTLGGVLQRMPDTLSGAPGARASSGITYALPAGTAALEAMEAGDIYGPEAATDRSALVDRLVADQGVRVVAACEGDSAPCAVGGLPDGTFVALWAPERSDLLLAAVAPTLDDVTLLVTAAAAASAR